MIDDLTDLVAEHCPRCTGEGEILECDDEFCHIRGDCIHDAVRECPMCNGSGRISTARAESYWSSRYDARAMLDPRVNVLLMIVVALVAAGIATGVTSL